MIVAGLRASDVPLSYPLPLHDYLAYDVFPVNASNPEDITPGDD